jgi:beta-fructofuranosidase
MIANRVRWLGLAMLGFFPVCGLAQDHICYLGDKTLLVWVAPATLDQAGGSVLTIDNGDGSFDGIVYGELEPKRWMPGSNGFSRTQKDQAAWPAESALPDQLVQLAIVYRGREIAMYRNGQEYAGYTVARDPQQFGWLSMVLFGRRHVDAADRERTFIGRIKDARIYAQPLDQRTIAALKPGRVSGKLKPWAWWSFADEGLREKTGRFNQITLLGDARIEKGYLVLGGKGATLIASSTHASGDSASTWAPVPREWSVNGPVPPEVIRSSRLLRERLLADPYRPSYHFCVPEDMGMPGDPNGAFFSNGRYHLMYLYHRNGSGFCWGHISSLDLVHWRYHHDAIGPGSGDDGCFSGGAFVDDDGTAYLSYWMLWGAKGIGLARSSDASFGRWTKLSANPVIRSTEWGVTEKKEADGKMVIYGSADPSNIWKNDGRYYMLTGSLLVLNKFGRAPDAPVEQQGDRLYLFTSDDLKTWKYLHVFYERNPQWTDRSEDNMCPSFLPLPSSPDGGPASGKHLLLFISHNRGCQFYVGEYRNDMFFPQNHGRMTWVDNTYFAPEALIDGKGRQIMWAWLTDNPPGEEQKGWSGVYGLPRTLWVGDDGTLRMRTVSELESLRCHERTWEDTTLDAGRTRWLDGVKGDACELQMEIDPAGPVRAGVKVRASKDGKEETLLYYDPVARELVFDATKSGVAGRMVVEHAPLNLPAGEPSKLRVFVDKAVVEVYANDRQAIGRRVYPAEAESVGLVLFTEGGPATFTKIKGWEISPSNPF